MKFYEVTPLVLHLTPKTIIDLVQPPSVDDDPRRQEVR